MESNWRYNIWEKGLTASVWTRCARILDFVGGEAYLVSVTGGSIYGVGLVLGVNQPPTIQFVGTSPFHFPNQVQNVVEPDH